MKVLFTTIFLLSFGFTSKIMAQNYSFETTDISMSVREDGHWSKFADPKEAKLMVRFDPKKDRITVFSEVAQFFKIVNYLKKQNLKDRDIVSFDCLNQEGTKCELAIHTMKKEKGANQLYIYYKDIILIYNMKYIEEKPTK
jgi:hypothetical protein